MPHTTLAASLLANARATADLDPAAAAALTALRTEAARFFTLDETAKRAHGSADFTYGFRPYGRQYSVSPDRPDMNESFTYWADNPATIPHHDTEAIAPLLKSLRDYWAVAAEITSTVLAGLSGHYGHPPQTLPFGDYSYLEINWYHPSDRDLLQDRHEDGHLLTLAIADGPGLEIEVGGAMEPVPVHDNRLLVMPGSLLTAMTGDDIPPLYHRVRNHQLPRRLTVLFLANPPLDQPVAPYVTRENSPTDISELARTKGAMFGLPTAPSNPAAVASPR